MGSDGTHGADDDAIRRSRVLLLVHGSGNRRQLREHIGRHHALVEPSGDELPAEGFDLVILDGPGFRHWRARLAEARNDEAPVFLPVMLVLPRDDLRRRASAHWDIVDEFVVTPLDRTEFLERVAMLLRARHMAAEQQDRLAHIVNHDSSTGLPNQGLFLERLQTAIHHAAVLDQSVFTVVVHVPLSWIMKSLGHEGLERAARACTTRLRHLVEDEHSLARLTTEQWGLMIGPVSSPDEVTEFCRRLGGITESPLEVARERIHVDTYIGVGGYPGDATTAAGTLDCAFGALSRTETPGEPYFYSRSVQLQALRYIRTESQLRKALERQEFELWFQPKMQLADATIFGAEALVRWRLASGELVPPGEFIPVAESSGLVRRIDRWVLESACATLARWRDDDGPTLRMAINITPADIAEPDFVEWVRDLLGHYGLLPQSIELELTETMFCNTDEATLDRLRGLKEYGVNVAVDDFGTGYSSLGYLNRLPVNVLKVDKSFVDAVPDDPYGVGITRAIVSLAHEFGLEVVAEGIERREQLEFLRSIGVERGQGYLMGRPMPEAEFLQHLARRGHRRRSSRPS